MKILVRILFLISVLTALSTVAFGQKTRIKFARGAVSTVVSGTLAGWKSHRTFVAHVRKGQQLTTGQVGKNDITITIEGPAGSNYEQDMAADCHSHNEIDPTAAGDYTLTVTECQKADRWKGPFKMRVRVR